MEKTGQKRLRTIKYGDRPVFRRIATLIKARRSATVRQLELLVEFLDARRNLALGRDRSKEARALSARLWQECSLVLNSEGPPRTPKEWSRFWNDFKCRVRSKLVNMYKGEEGPGGPHSLTLTPLEERAAHIIGHDIISSTGDQQDPLQGDDEYENEENYGTFIVVPKTESPVIEVKTQVDVESVPVTPPPANQPSIASPPSPGSQSSASQSPTRLPLPDGERSPSPVNQRRQRRNPVLKTNPRHIGRSRRHYSSPSTSVDQTLAIITRLEVMRAKTDAILAKAALKQSEAALRQSEAAMKHSEAAMKHSEAVMKQSEAAIKQTEAMTIIARALATIAENLK